MGDSGQNWRICWNKMSFKLAIHIHYTDIDLILIYFIFYIQYNQTLHPSKGKYIVVLDDIVYKMCKYIYKIYLNRI